LAADVEVMHNVAANSIVSASVAYAMAIFATLYYYQIHTYIHTYKRMYVCLLIGATRYARGGMSFTVLCVFVVDAVNKIDELW